MSLFAKQTVFLLLKKDGLQIITKSQQSQQLTFPIEVVKHQEIVNGKRFEQILHEFFSQTKLSGSEGVLFLADTIVFQKHLPLTASEEDIQNFFSTIPFSQQIIAKKVLKTAKDISLFALNRDLYSTIVLLAQQQIAIRQVVPVTVFPLLTQNSQISFQLLAKALSNRGLVEAANFLQEDENTKAKNTSIAKTPIRQYIMLGVSLLFLLGAVAVALINLGLLPSKQENKAQNMISGTPTTPPTTPQISPTLTPQTSTSTSAIDKSTIKIQILNGSGASGQASLVKDHLVPLGFTNIQVGNASSVSAKTKITYTKQVPLDYSSSIQQELQKLFIDVTNEQIASGSANDVIIITGETKK